MKRVVCGLCALVMVGVVPGVSFAQEDGVGGKKVKEMVFAEDEIEGARINPGGERVEGDKMRRRSSLMKVRSNFVPEMLKSVEDL